MKSTCLFDLAREKEEKGLGIAILTVIGRKGVTPRRSARMIVFSDGSFSGTVGGGEAERMAIRDALALIKTGVSEIRNYRVSHGGEISIMIDVVSRKKSVYIFGSGHVAKALEEAFAFIGFEIHTVDAFFGNGEKRFMASYADENTAIIFTDHQNRDLFLDEAEKSDAFYIGAVGSRAKVMKKERIYSPTGLDILSDTPEEVAISITAEVVAALNRKRGVSYREEKKRLIIVRGAGDLATAVIIRLRNAGYNVLALEVEKPSVIRRTVSFAEAVYEWIAEVEGVRARKVDSVSEVFSSFDEGFVPVLVDADAKAVEALRPEVVIDAIIAKRNLGTRIDDAPLTVALGPGFEAGSDVDYVVETKRGHNLARIIRRGKAEENTGIPGVIEGYGKERVIHSPADGKIRNARQIGDIVRKGDVIAYVSDVPVMASIDGMVRGLIHDGYDCCKGLKIADIDPRGDKAEYMSISDKARAVSGSVLEIVDSHYNC